MVRGEKTMKPLCLAWMVFLALGAPLPATPVEIAPAEDRDAIAWGKPRDDVRIGLASEDREVLAMATSVNVTLWYENLGTEKRRVLTFQGGNRCPVLFSASQGEHQLYIDFDYGRRTTLTPLRYVTLEPGKRFHEQINVPFESKIAGNFANVPRPDAKQTVALTAGLCTEPDTKGKKSWDAADTRHSGAITFRLIDRLVIAGPKFGKEPVRVKVGKPFEVRLESAASETAWELRPTFEEKPVLSRVGARHIPRGEPAVGTYVFTFTATRAGEETLDFQFVFPRGTGKKAFGSTIVSRAIIKIQAEE
jgi:hypothetical protein